MLLQRMTPEDMTDMESFVLGLFFFNHIRSTEYELKLVIVSGEHQKSCRIEITYFNLYLFPQFLENRRA